MKVLTVLGTRPEIIRLSRVIPLLDRTCAHKVVHTGQNYVRELNQIFFTQLRLRLPDYEFNCKADSLMGQIGKILTKCEKVMKKEKPDRLLVLGDTNSALAAVVAKRLGIPVFHMEAGNRCYDDRVPEEVNRRVVDHCSDVLLPYTERSRANLLREGVPGQRIFVTGNPILEVLEYYAPEIEASLAVKMLGLEPNSYFLVTLHRAENVDNTERLDKFIEAFRLIQRTYQVPLVLSLHPRTRSRMDKAGRMLSGEGIRTMEPVGLFDFIQLERNALCVLSDSGTVQEECCIFKIPNVTLRDVTERPETIEVGGNILAGADPARILSAVELALSQPCTWEPPAEYLVKNVARTVVKILMGETR